MTNKQFEELYKKSLSPLTRFVFNKIGSNPDVADDIIANTFAAAWKGYKSFKHKSTFITWLCRIALNKIADYYHDQVHEGSRIVVPLLDSVTQMDKESLGPEERLALKELRASVNDCLNLLPYEKRRLLWFRYWKDMSYNQIAKVLGLSERAVEGKIYRAKHDFAKVWNQNKN